MTILLSPPVLLTIFILLGVCLTRAVKPLAAPGEENERKGEPYACGQRHIEHNVVPDYRQFFPVAFFFTIMHVLILVVATTPLDALLLPLLYVAAGLLSLLIIFRR